MHAGGVQALTSNISEAIRNVGELQALGSGLIGPYASSYSCISPPWTFLRVGNPYKCEFRSYRIAIATVMGGVWSAYAPGNLVPSYVSSIVARIERNAR